MSKLKALIIAAVAAVATELLAVACLMHTGGDSPDVFGRLGLVLFFPTLTIERWYGGLGNFGLLLIGFAQFFVVCWLIVLLWRHLRYGRKTA
jgi:hypothetical protein